MNTSQPQPFEHIALSLSGGGYRAAAFHLGTMAYLHKLDMLTRVKTISTVSGGTFPGLMYAFYLKSGRTFEDCYQSLYTLMHSFDLVEEGLKLLATGNHFNDHKSENLINAMAEIYHRNFFDQANFGVLWNDQPTHLDNMIYNATEFDYGLAFRFQKTINDRAKIGNQYFDIPDEAAMEIRLGDIAAASSCFPVGFEPIKFPDDFLYDEATHLLNLKNNNFKNPVAMMDGGIVDNQGIGSIMLTNQRDNKYPDLFLISDVAGRRMDKFEFPAKKPSKSFGKLSLKVANHLLIAFALLLIVIFGGGLYLSFTNFANADLGLMRKIMSLIFNVTLPLILVVVAWLLLKVRKVIRDEGIERVPNLQHRAWLYLKRLQLNRLSYLLKTRTTSAITMVNDVFLRQVRRLIYGQIYNDEKYKDVRLSNLIYTFQQEEIDKRIKENKYQLPDELLNPSGKLKKSAERAIGMSTTLWFTKSDKKVRRLENLIGCGSYTCCFRLLEYYHRLQLEAPDKVTADLELLYTVCLDDWKKFNKNPLWLFEQMQDK